MFSVKRALLVTASVGLISGLIFLLKPNSSEHWPTSEVSDEDKVFASAKNAQYIKDGLKAKIIKTYEPTGFYLGASSLKAWVETETRIFDHNGIPKIKYGNYYYYNPVTVSQFALAGYGACKLDKVNCSTFMAAISALQYLQSDDGAFRYSFGWKHFRMPTYYKVGWISAMAQGQAISAYSRAYLHTKDKKYLELGEKAFRFLLKSVDEGGPKTTLEDLDPSLTKYIFFCEYITKPTAYTLNGYMFTLIGLYDWWKIAKSDDAKQNFINGIETLKKILPYYDLESFTSYDISHITMKLPKQFIPLTPRIDPVYHQVHIELLQVMYSITKDPIFKNYAEKWQSYVSTTKLYEH